MKKIQFISALLLVVMVLCSCTNTDYQKAIPANATLVVKADMKAISEKADFKNSPMMKMMDLSLAAVVKDKDVKKVKEYIDDPMKMGIDFSMPLYFFMVGENTLGLTMKMGNDDEVRDFLLLLNKQGLASKPLEKNGLMCGTLLDDICYSYDANTFLLLASMSGEESSAISRMAHELMDLKEADSFANTEAFERLNEEEKDVVCYAGFKVMQQMSGWEMLLPESLKPNDVDFISSLNFEEGRASLKLRVCGKTDKARQAIEEDGKNFGEIKGTFVDRASDSLMVWVGANMKGEWLLKRLKKSQNIKEVLFMMERVLDIEQMIRAVDGDVAIEYQMPDINSSEEPGHVMYAEVKNTDFMADVEDWIKMSEEYGLKMRQVGDDQYEVERNGKTDTYTWGVKDHVLYSAQGRDVCLTNGEGKNPLAAYKDDIRNSRYYVYVNLEQFPLEQLSGSEAMLMSALSGLKSIVLKSSAADEVTLTVDMKNKDENFLKQLLK